MDAHTAEEGESNHIQENEAISEKDSTSSSIINTKPTEGLFGLFETTPSPSALSLNHAPIFDYVIPTALPSKEIHCASKDDPAFEQASDDMRDVTQVITKDLFLFDHYMDHTCRDLESHPSVARARKLGIPQLAAEHQGILCSTMALGAVCLCIDLLLGRGFCSQNEDLSRLISAGDRYHRLGLQSVRLQLATNQPRDLAEAYAHSILLFPYALARRRISYLLNDVGPPTPVSGVDTQAEHLGSMDWTIVLRGISTTSRACDSSASMDGSMKRTANDRPEKTHPTISSHILAKLAKRSDQQSRWGDFQCCPASRHPLFPVLSATRLVALKALQRKVESVNLMMRDHHRKDIPAIDFEKTNVQLARSLSLAACSMAVDLLMDLANTLFNAESTAARGPLPVSDSTGSFQGDSSLPWLRSYVGLPVYDPALPALRTVFAWVNRTPDEYFRLLMQPLPGRVDQQAEHSGQKPTSPNIDREIQLLAWEIWAHWLVFAILVENESFFTADLGVPDIIGLSSLFRTSNPSCSSPPGSPPTQTQDWWPLSMCSVAQQLRKYHGEGPTG